MILLTVQFSYFIGKIVNELLIFYNQNPLFSFVSKEIIQILIFALCIYFGLKMIINQKEIQLKSLKKSFIWLVILYVLIQILDSLYSFYGISSFDGYLDKLVLYKDYIKTNYFILIVSSIVYYLQLLLFGIIVVNHSIKND